MKPWRTAGGERATHPANPPPRRSKEAQHRARAGEPELRTGPTAATEQTIPPVHSSPCLCGSVRAPKRSTHLTPPLHAPNKAARSALIRARARARARAQAQARARARARARKIAGATLKGHYRKAARNNRPSSPFAASREIKHSTVALCETTASLVLEKPAPATRANPNNRQGRNKSSTSTRNSNLNPNSFVSVSVHKHRKSRTGYYPCQSVFIRG